MREPYTQSDGTTYAFRHLEERRDEGSHYDWLYVFEGDSSPPAGGSE